ncbi:MAG: DUF1638 domain-containing protein [Kiritimatiellae bacterium]|nr:DUF1638 domain-containing protein [Kiritimatiellia bacterium]
MNHHVSFEDRCIVSCGILRPELSALAEAGFLDARKILYTPPGLHVLPDKLEQHLSRALAKAKEECAPRNIVVAYGRRCYTNLENAGKSVDTLIASHGPDIRRVQAEYGYDMLAGLDQRTPISGGQPEKVLWFTPGWLSAWKTIYQKYFGWDKADANANFPGYYKKIVVLDAIGASARYNTDEPEKILELFDWTGVPVEFEPITLDRFKKLLSQCVQP